jgi:hypothetical protein
LLWQDRREFTCAGDYGRYFGGTLPPELRKLPGFEGAYLLRRDLGEDGTVELTAHTFWESPEAIRDFAGDDITLSAVEPEARAMLLDFDRTAAHRSVVVEARGSSRCRQGLHQRDPEERAWPGSNCLTQTCLPSSFQPSLPTPAPSASSTTRSMASTSRDHRPAADPPPGRRPS